MTDDMGRDASPEGHPGQAEGEDIDRMDVRPDPSPAGHPSQAEGEDDEDEQDSTTSPRTDGLPKTTDENGFPLENPSG